MGKDADDTHVQVHFDDDGRVCRVEVHGLDGQWWGRGERLTGRRIVTYIPRKLSQIRRKGNEMSGPIKPSEVRQHKTDLLPEEVFIAFSDCIAITWDGRSSVVKQRDVVGRIAAAMSITTAEVVQRHYLDVEEAYRAHGWDVEYDKPGYNETYEATFRFTTGKR